MLKKSLLLLTTTAILWPAGAAMAAGGNSHHRAEQTHVRQVRPHVQRRTQPQRQQHVRQQRTERQQTEYTRTQSSERHTRMMTRGNDGERAYQAPTARRAAPATTYRPRADQRSSGAYHPPAEQTRRTAEPRRTSEPRVQTRTTSYPRVSHTQAAPASERRVVNPRSAPRHTTGMPVRRDIGGNSTTIHRATEGDVRTPHARSVTPPVPAVRTTHAGERVVQAPSVPGRQTTSHSSVVNRGQGDIERLRAQEDLARVGEYRSRGTYSFDQDRPRRDTRTSRRDRDDRRHVQDRDRRDRRDHRTYRDRDDRHRLWYHDRYRRIYRSYYWPHYYNSFWWDSYYRSYIYYRPYYFGDWPYYSGYWPSYSRWVWYAPHHHYHYGGWCPGLSYEYTVRYSSDPYAYSPPDANNVVGTILGGVVGGIIGGEIDGSRHHRAGTVIGALVGAAIGNAITQPQVSRGYDSSTTYRRDDYEPNTNDPGAYTYGQENYVPPEQKRSCLEYKMQNGAYVCTKWGIDYVYDDKGDTPQQ